MIRDKIEQFDKDPSAWAFDPTRRKGGRVGVWVVALGVGMLAVLSEMPLDSIGVIGVLVALGIGPLGGTLRRRVGASGS